MRSKLQRSLDIFLKETAEQVEQRLDALIPLQEKPYNELFHAARYSILGGGKRVRPILTIAAAEVLGCDLHTALTPACAIEIIHTYSLIHDDLPCMDDDDYRRGKPSLHKVFPEGHAVLTGDYLLTYAFEVLAETPELSSDQKLQLIACLSKAAGAHGMIGGQIMDLAENKQADLAYLRHMHSGKTGALITAALEFGGIIARAPEPILCLLREFGGLIGLAFQVVDDVLDAEESTSKVTYVSLLGLEEAKVEAQRLLTSALEKLKAIPGDMTLLADLSNYLVYRQF